MEMLFSGEMKSYFTRLRAGEIRSTRETPTALVGSACVTVVACRFVVSARAQTPVRAVVRSELLVARNNLQVHVGWRWALSHR